MPIGPFSAGILPGGSSSPEMFFPGPSTTWTNPIMIDFGTSGTGASAFGAPASGFGAPASGGTPASFLPEVTDWFSPVQQSPGVQTTAQQTPPTHSCQSGGDCGCGGTCKNKPQSDASKSTPEKKAYRDLSKNPLSKSEALEFDKQLGNTFIAGNPSANGAIVTVDQIDNDLLVRIRRITDASILFETTFQQTANGWSIGETLIQGNFPKISFGIAAFANLAVQQMTASKLGQNLSFDTESGSFVTLSKAQTQQNITKASSGTGYPILQTPPAQSPCIKYDLICTMPFVEADGQHLSLWMLPIGNFQVDIGSCCHAHDIAWWCAQTPLDVTTANSNVVGCIAAQILDAAIAACNNDLSCGGLFHWFCDLAVAACVALAAPFVAAYEVAVNIGGPIGTTLAELEQETDLFNFDGSHSNSCLCGGTEVTYQCPGYIDTVAGNDIYGNPCRNVCLEVGSNAGAQPGCFNCYWNCTYDSNHNLEANSPLVTEGKTCCTGSAGTVSPYDGSQCDTLSQSCPAQNCSQCKWGCKDGYYYLYTGDQMDEFGQNIVSNSDECCPPLPQLPGTLGERMEFFLKYGKQC